MDRIRSTIAVICTTLGVFGVSMAIGYQAKSEAASPENRVAAFVVHEQVFHFPRSHTAAVLRKNTYARRSDGSYVRTFEVASPTGEMGRAAEIIDVRRRTIVTLEPFTKSAMTSYYSEVELQRQLETQESCGSNGLVGSQASFTGMLVDEIQGRQVVQVVSRRTKAASSEKWVAPELDCYPLRTNESFSNGAYNQTTVTKIEMGEPPDSMFHVPAGYVEASPLQLEALYSTKFPGHEFWGTGTARTLEVRYQKHRNK